MHSRLVVLAELEGNDIAAQGSVLLEKMIMGEWHTVTVAAEKMTRLGLTGNVGQGNGNTVKLREVEGFAEIGNKKA
ncbi:TPA: hypothetical protein ACGCAV_001625 [Acinetobacter nosocomialis]|uniref:hypothetical protein n=1 Tax=Acinetobacter nosocomialis TaxID=106654 RepID=UPI001D0E0274|nr:hypothetical protein [Acinetobacter nosocomialis]